MSSPTLSLPPAIGVGDLAASPIDKTKTLLGDRWLCRGGAVVMVGSTGVGKSSASMQQDILWALGKEAFGIKPNGSLKVLTIQAENDTGDLAVMSRGVMDGLELTQDERDLANEKAKYVQTIGSTGDDLLDLVAKYLEQYRPDILRLDPLQAFLGGDINSAEVVAKFLRSGLNTLLAQYDCGLILVHHTPKPSRSSDKNRPDDFSHVGMGSSDITNWARAGLYIESSHERGVYRFRATKRGGAIGWRDDFGQKEYERWYKHGDNNWVWEASEASIRKPGQKDYSANTVMLEVPERTSEGIYRSTLIANANKNAGIPITKVQAFIEQLLDEGQLKAKEAEVGKKGGRKATVYYRARGVASWYRDKNGRAATKMAAMAEPPHIQEEAEFNNGILRITLDGESKMRQKIHQETDLEKKAALQVQLDQGKDNQELAFRLSEWVDSNK